MCSRRSRRYLNDHSEEAAEDAQVTIQDLIAEGDKVVARLLGTGTNTGPFAGQPPTGKRVTFSSFRIYRLVDGKVVEPWAMQDRLGLMEQLGFLQSPDCENGISYDIILWRVPLPKFLAAPHRSRLFWIKPDERATNYH